MNHELQPINPPADQLADEHILGHLYQEIGHYGELTKLCNENPSAYSLAWKKTLVESINGALPWVDNTMEVFLDNDGMVQWRWIQEGGPR